MKKKIIKIVKITKQSYGYKGYASTYNADILNSFNPEIKLKNAGSAIENKLKDLFLIWEGWDLWQDNTGCRLLKNRKRWYSKI